MEQSRQRPGGPRKGGSSARLCERASAWTRAISPRQLPTDHDHDGQPGARSANIRVINRRACRPAAVHSAPHHSKRENGGAIDRSFHISRVPLTRCSLLSLERGRQPARGRAHAPAAHGREHLARPLPRSRPRETLLLCRRCANQGPSSQKEAYRTFPSARMAVAALAH